VFEEFAKGKTVTPAPFPRIPYRESMRKYGSDKPDLRNPLLVHDVTERFRDSEFNIFARIVAEGGVVRSIPAPLGRRALCDRVLKWAETEGFRATYITFEEGIFPDEWSHFIKTPDEEIPQQYLNLVKRARNGESIPVARGPVANNLDRERLAQIARDSGVGPGDAVILVSGKELPTSRLAGVTRNRVGEELGLIEEGSFKFCWIVDFPMYEYDEDAKKVDFSHNPFSMPQGELHALETMDPLDILAFQYDIVCNGVELSSGAIRNHRPEIMYKAFEIAGYSQQDVDENFAGMINSFKFGAPPHGGSAPGIDRIVMLLADEPNIREVITFPMNQKAEDLMMGAPAPVSLKQLRELNIRVVDGPKG
jgi:aspartyl-tRNA synthetase